MSNLTETFVDLINNTFKTWNATKVDSTKPCILHEENASAYLEDSTKGCEALKSILTGKQILVRVPNADGGSFTAIYSPVLFYQLPNFNNEYLYLFYMKDGVNEMGLPSYGQLKLKLDREYNYNPLESTEI